MNKMRKKNIQSNPLNRTRLCHIFAWTEKNWFIFPPLYLCSRNMVHIFWECCFECCPAQGSWRALGFFQAFQHLYISIFRLQRPFFTLIFTSGIGSMVGDVNTDFNWLRSVSILDLLSCSNVPFELREDTPRLSCFFDLTYFQNGLELLFLNPSLIVLLMYEYSAFLKSKISWNWHEWTWSALKFS